MHVAYLSFRIFFFSIRALNCIETNGYSHAVAVSSAPTLYTGMSNDVGLPRLRVHSGVALHEFSCQMHSVGKFTASSKLRERKVTSYPSRLHASTVTILVY